MSEQLHRTQLLLEPEQYRALAEIARCEGRSISRVVREMINEQLDRRQQAASTDLERRVAVLERIRQHREAVLARREGKTIDVTELINQMREEQDDRNVGDLIDDRRD